MDHKELACRKLDRQNFERNSTLVRPQEKHSVAFPGLRPARENRVRAMLDDVTGARGIDPVAVR
jgi:hypothetical protein